MKLTVNILKILISVVGLCLAIFYLINGIVAALSFEAESLSGLVLVGHGIYLINTVLGIVLVLVVIGIFKFTRAWEAGLAVIGMLLTFASMVLNPVSMIYSILTVILCGLVIYLRIVYLR